MPLQAFSFPLPETRVLRAGRRVYKFKIRGGGSYSGDTVIGDDGFNRELEDIIRTVLGNVDSLQPFTSARFVVYPYKTRWEGVSEVMSKHEEEEEEELTAYPFVLTLYLEKNVRRGKKPEEKRKPEKPVPLLLPFPSVSEVSPKRIKCDSPLEEAMLQDFLDDLEAEAEHAVLGKRPQDKPHGQKIAQDAGCTDRDAGINMVRKSGNLLVDEEEEENLDSVPESPEGPGILTRLVSNILPFSWFFRDS